MYCVNGKYKFRDNPNREMWIIGDHKGWIYYCTDGYTERMSKIYYKEPKGIRSNRYGQYFIAVFPDGGKKYIYLNELLEYK